MTTTLKRLIAADNARDLAGALASYADDIVWLSPTGDALDGIATIRARYERMFAEFAPALELEVREGFGNGDIGIVVGYTRGELRPVGGGEPVRVDDKFLSVLQCRDGRWLISHLAWSPRRNPNYYSCVGVCESGLPSRGHRVLLARSPAASRPLAVRQQERAQNARCWPPGCLAQAGAD